MNNGMPKIDRVSILQFLKTQKFAVLSTVGKDGLPDAAPIYYIVNENFDFFLLQKKKRRNIKIFGH